MEAEQRRCYRHPDRETGLSCSECGRPICYECMTPAAVGLRCPEHSGKPQGVRKVTTAAGRAMSGEGSRRPFLITMILIGACVTVYLAELAIGSGEGGQNNWIYNHGTLIANGFYVNKLLLSCPTGTVGVVHGAFYGCLAGSSAGAQAMIGVAHGEWWRLLTSAFLHYGILHLGINMMSLYFGGRILEVVIGRWRFLLLYVVAAIAGSALALWVTPQAASAGASGAIFGVFGALLVLERRGTIQTGGQVLMLIVLNLVFTFAFPGISIGDHIGGLVAGILVMAAYLRFRTSVPLSVAAALGVVLLSLILAAAKV